VLEVHLSVILMYINSQTQLYFQVLAISSFGYLLLFLFLMTCFNPFIWAIFRSTIVQIFWSPLLPVTPIKAHLIYTELKVKLTRYALNAL
jgi:uncharacterized protein (DUF983 family)